MLRKMLGLESHKPTDCVGTVSEARLAFAMCRAKGVGGVIADDIDVAPMLDEAPRTLERYLGAATPGSCFPPTLAARLEPGFRAQGAATRAYAIEVLRLDRREGLASES